MLSRSRHPLGGVERERRYGIKRVWLTWRGGHWRQQRDPRGQGLAGVWFGLARIVDRRPTVSNQFLPSPSSWQVSVYVHRDAAAPFSNNMPALDFNLVSLERRCKTTRAPSWRGREEAIKSGQSGVEGGIIE